MAMVAMTPFRAFKGVYDAEKETFTAQEEIPLARLSGLCTTGVDEHTSYSVAFLKGAVFGIGATAPTKPVIIVTDRYGGKKRLSYNKTLTLKAFKGVTVDKKAYSPILYGDVNESYCVLMEYVNIGVGNGG